MDTSGIVIFALTEQALKQLHSDFRDRDRIKKTYQALLCGHLEVSEGEIDLPLERDPIRPPFMRISLPDRPLEVSRAHESFAKYLDKAPKPSLTEFRVLSREYLEGVPVTRVELYPKTGRTHQLRVHCAALGHSIIGDDIYGLGGDGSPDGGLMHEQRNVFWDRASRLHQEQLLHQRPNLCLHAEQLCIYHPFSRAPMSFRANPSF
jgi:23S rRNA-/tRNA-specific pseudouridylate synthase